MGWSRTRPLTVAAKAISGIAADTWTRTEPRQRVRSAGQWTRLAAAFSAALSATLRTRLTKPMWPARQPPRSATATPIPRVLKGPQDPPGIACACRRSHDLTPETTRVPGADAPTRQERSSGSSDTWNQPKPRVDACAFMAPETPGRPAEAKAHHGGKGVVSPVEGLSGLPDDDVEFLDAHVSNRGLPSRSAALHKAVWMLKQEN